MKIDDILRPQQAGVIEIAGFEIERVKGLLLGVVGISVTAGDIRLHSQPWFAGDLEGVTGVEAACPSQDGVVPETSQLPNFFGVPIPVAPFTKLPTAERMAMFITGAGGVRAILAVNSEVIKISADRV